jgi:MYXO-CTERM domain-containing protein
MKTMHPLSRLVLPGLVALALGAASSARATPNFPGAIQSELNLAREPNCNLCHVGVEARGTVNTPFGGAMRQRGMQAYDEGLLLDALTLLREQGVDSDGDGQPDVEELLAGGDPNQVAEELPPEPSFGCAASSGGPAGWMLLVALGALRARRPAGATGRPPGRAWWCR